MCRLTAPGARIPRLAVIAVASALGSIAPPSTSHAFRPFESTDAEVAGLNELEVELGYLTLEREDRDDSFKIPSLVLNYGVAGGLEAIGELEVERAPDGDLHLTDTELALKAVLREGALQGAPGLSIAAEFSALLPSTSGEDNNVGGQAVVITSGVIRSLIFHVNVGGGVERAESQPFAIWGIIGEFPILAHVRAVAEISGEHTNGERPVNSALFGVIWQPFPNRETTFDLGIRPGLSDLAPDWAVTLGVTFSLPVQ